MPSRPDDPMTNNIVAFPLQRATKRQASGGLDLQGMVSALSYLTKEAYRQGYRETGHFLAVAMEALLADSPSPRTPEQPPA
jgi:hypothetical protein